MTKGPILSNFLVKVSHSPMTAIVLVFLVHAQFIDKDNCQKLVTTLQRRIFAKILTLKIGNCHSCI